MVTAKVNAPSFQAYDPTQLETALATAWANPQNDIKGSTANMLWSYGLDRQRGIDQYVHDLGESNKLQVLLAQQEMQNELANTALKELAPMTNAGLNLSDIPIAARFSATGFRDPQSAAASSSVVQKRLAEVAELHARAAAHNATSADKWTVEVGTDANGAPTYKLSGKGASPQALADTGVNVARTLPYTSVNPAPGSGSTTPPQGAPGSVPPSGPRVGVPVPSVTPPYVQDPNQRLKDQMARNRGQHTIPGTSYSP